MIKYKEVTILIQNGKDRENIILALINSGHEVWLEQKDILPSDIDYYVHFKIREEYIKPS